MLNFLIKSPMNKKIAGNFPARDGYKIATTNIY